MADADNVVTLVDPDEVPADAEPMQDMTQEEASQQSQQQNGDNKDKDRERSRRLVSEFVGSRVGQNGVPFQFLSGN